MFAARLRGELAARGERAPQRRPVHRRAAERLRARAAKEWSTADELRDELLAMGIAIKDGPEGTTWERVVQ